MEKIAIVTNYQSDSLYAKCKEFYEDSMYEIVKISGKNGLYGWAFLDFITRTLDYDWVILVDEDCFITDLDAVHKLLKFSQDNNLHCVGVPDGGVLNTRKHNPTAINPFFTILHLSEIKKKYKYEEVKLCQSMCRDFKELTPHHLIKQGNPYDYDGFEPYYRYFFWLHNNGFNTLFLDGEDFYSKGDKWTSIVKWNNKKLAYHTWMARYYDTLHTTRIDSVYNHCKKMIENGSRQKIL